MRIHRFIQHIQERVEMDLRVWRYLLPPRDELDGHEIMGSLPVWQPIEQTDHFICQKGNKDELDQWYISWDNKTLMYQMDVKDATCETS